MCIYQFKKCYICDKIIKIRIEKTSGGILYNKVYHMKCIDNQKYIKNNNNDKIRKISK
jgi:hypothetical protein